MRSRGRPRIYYAETTTKKQVIEPLDLCLKKNILTDNQHKLALKLRWLYTTNFGIPTVQACNPSKTRGRVVSKYDLKTLELLRNEYKRIIDFIHTDNRTGARVFLGMILHHQVPECLSDNITDIKRMLYSINTIRTSAKLLEKAFAKSNQTPGRIDHGKNINYQNVYRN